MGSECGEEEVASDRPLMWCPQADSNCRPCLRRAVLYPLSYGGPDAIDLALIYGSSSRLTP